MDTNINHSNKNGIGIITLNNPQRHNAFDDTIIKKLTEIILSYEDDSEIKLILLNANGKNFSAGADLDWMRRMIHYSENENIADAMQLAKLLQTLFNCTKPTIALAQGMTIGGGVGLLACCDIVIAHHEARFCFSEAKLGLIPATIAPYIVRAIGPRATQYYFLTANTFSAIDAQRIGLIQEIHQENNLYSAGLEFANSILKNGPQALTNIKKLLSRFNLFDDEFLHETAVLIAKIRTSPEAQEGLNAFLEKRPPRWHETPSDIKK